MGPAGDPPGAAPAPRLVSTGSVVVDLPLLVPGLPARGGDVLATTAGPAPGGGFNVVAAAARQGARVAVASPVGTGPNGDLVRAALRAEGVEVLTAPAPGDTGVVVALVEPDGERTFVTTIGAEGRPRAAELGAVAPRPGDLVYVSGYDLVYPDAAPVVGPWAAALPAGVRLLLDPSPLAGLIPAEVLDPVLARCDVLTVNAQEAAHLAGSEPGREDGRTGLCSRVPARCAVLVRLGVAGCWVREPGGGGSLVPSRPVRPVDTTGAGDVHTGVLAAGLLAGTPLLEAVRRANAAAAIAVTRVGGGAAPTRAELEAVLGARDAGRRRRSGT
ncbi:sugar kinase [Georgenia thermotolerans]|uniref:Sugar kinase n=1 Tax=Georgenia thermotolerans TaxID=527326 RepID=A0A7J5UMM8_9MICO|nr:sugar kinase [Georgenia thermotolerans]